MKLAYPVTFRMKDRILDTYEDVTTGTTVYTLARDPQDDLRWVFRVNGVEYGRSRYRNDLAEHCNFKLAYPGE